MTRNWNDYPSESQTAARGRLLDAELIGPHPRIWRALAALKRITDREFTGFLLGAFVMFLIAVAPYLWECLKALSAL